MGLGPNAQPLSSCVCVLLIDCSVHLKGLSYGRTDIEPLAAKIAALAKRNIARADTLAKREQYD